MIGRIVEVADDRRHLLLHRGFMVVRDTEGERKELGQIPLDDIAAVIANAHGLSTPTTCWWLWLNVVRRLCCARPITMRSACCCRLRATLNSPNALKRK